MFFTCRFSAFLAKIEEAPARGREHESRIKRAESEDYYTWINACNSPKTALWLFTPLATTFRRCQTLYLFFSEREKIDTWERKSLFAYQVSLFPFSLKSSFRFKWWFFSNLRPIFRYVHTLIMPMSNARQRFADKIFGFFRFLQGWKRAWTQKVSPNWRPHSATVWSTGNCSYRDKSKRCPRLTYEVNVASRYSMKRNLFLVTWTRRTSFSIAWCTIRLRKLYWLTRVSFCAWFCVGDFNVACDELWNW